MDENNNLDHWILINVMNRSEENLEKIPEYSSSMEYIFQVREAMKNKGFTSHDRYTNLGWGYKDGKPVYGYSIWFEKWERIENEHGKLVPTGKRFTGMGSTSDPLGFAGAVCRAAKMALTSPIKG